MLQVTEEEAAKLAEHTKQANDYQVGGDHYRKVQGEQHWDRIWRLYGPGYFIGCITKYVERYQDKNGVEDLRKAQHFLQKLIELEEEKLKKIEQSVECGCSVSTYNITISR